jgi:hypothetical protein
MRDTTGAMHGAELSVEVNGDGSSDCSAPLDLGEGSGGGRMRRAHADTGDADMSL